MKVLSELTLKNIYKVKDGKIAVRILNVPHAVRMLHVPIS